MHRAVIAEEIDRAWTEAHTGHPNGALYRLQTLAELLNEKNDPALAWRFHWVFGSVQFLLGNLEAAYEHSQKARALSRGLGLVIRANAATFNGDMLLALGLSDEAFSESLIGRDLAEKSGDDWAIAHAYYVLALLTQEGGDPGQSKEYAERALERAHQAGDPYLISWIETVFACILADLADLAKLAGDEAGFYEGYEAAVRVCHDAANRARDNSYSWVERVALSNGADIYATTGRFREAHLLLDRWRGVEGELSNRRLLHYLANRAEVFFAEGRLKEALDMCNQALEVGDAESIFDLMRECMRLLSSIHEGLGDFKAALSYYKQFHQYAQRVEGEKIKSRARAAAIFYETEKFRNEAKVVRQIAERSAMEATTDPLTGIANRRQFDREFVRRLAERPDDLAVLFLDLDGFKWINDSYSHAVGDLVLQAATQVFAECCREVDFISRIGGDEFVILLDGVDRGAAEAAACRLLDGIRGFDWSTIAEDLLMTISIGMAVSSEEKTRERLLALADARLYRAKSSGRDKFVGCDAPEGTTAGELDEQLRVKPVSDDEMEQVLSPPSALEDGPAVELD